MYTSLGNVVKVSFDNYGTQKVAENNTKVCSEKPDTQNVTSIFAIGGGKGGVGKTVIAASLGVGLAMLNRKVVVVDADLGDANLHKVMGVEKPSTTYYNFYNRECKQLDEILIDHPHFDNLKIISGTSGVLGIANLQFSQKMKFIRHFKKIDADFVILDLGGGSNYNVLDFFLAADNGIVVVNPDPLSVLDSYNFVKQAFYRKITQTVKSHGKASEVVKEYSLKETHRIPSTVENLLHEINQIDSTIGKEIEKFLDEFHPMLIINEINNSDDEANGLAVKIAAKELLSIDMEYLGAIHQDDTVRKSLDVMNPFISYDSNSPASRDLAHIIITKILHARKFQTVRAKHTLHKQVKQKKEIEKAEFICSVKCRYWDECDFKKGGYPCILGGV